MTLLARRPSQDRTSAKTALNIALICIAAGTIAGGCDNVPGSQAASFPSGPAGHLEITYPLDESVFPPDIAAPMLTWQDATEGVAFWEVMLRRRGSDELLRFRATEPRWRPSESDWSEIKRMSVDTDAEIAIVGLEADASPASSALVRIRTSEDPVADSIFYREVPLPFISAVQDPSKIRWRFGSVDSIEQPPVVLEDLPVCGNCHSFSADGSVLGMDVDYGNDKGAYAVLDVAPEMELSDEHIITWSDYRPEDEQPTFGLLSQVSPDGRYVISTVKDRAVFVATPGIEFSQLFFPIKGILAVFDRQTGRFFALPGADDPEYVQSNPTWSPDGRYVVFARAKAYRKPTIENARGILLDENDVPEFIEDNEPFKFDLYRVPFNEGRGGVAEPIEGASHNGMSNYFAKFSPDGRWIVFCKAENYMLLMPDSELYIIPAGGGEARRLRANTPRMNSWHSFSSNGRWLVFSSKANTPYTQLFLTHIDRDGNSTPPIVLDRFTGTYGAANIPEFVPRPSSSIARIEERFLDAYSFLRAGIANERTGNYPAAVRAYQRGLEVEPGNVELLNAMGFALFQQGSSDEAMVAFEKALALDPMHWKAHNNMALAAIDVGELELAEAHYMESLAIQPQPAIYNDLGAVLERQGLAESAVDAYRKALVLDPELSSARFNLAAALARAGEFAEAESLLRALIEQSPTTEAYTGLGIVLWRQNLGAEAISSLRAAISSDPGNAGAYDALGMILVEQGKLEEAATTYRQLLEHQSSAAAHERLAQVLRGLGREEDAQLEMAKAQALQESADLREGN